MKLFKRTLTALLVSATLFGAGCQGTPPSNATQDQTETSSLLDGLMPDAPEAPGVFSVDRMADGQWQFRLIGAHGDVVMVSEHYEKKESVYNGILAIQESGVLAEQYEVAEDDRGAFNFYLQALGNNEPIGHSVRFGTEDEARDAFEVARQLVIDMVRYKAAITDGARFDLWRDAESRDWLFVLRGDDGNILLESQGYTGRTDAVNGIDSVRENGRIEARYRIDDESDGTYLVLRAGNNREIARTGPFESEVEAGSARAELIELISSEQVANPW
ncbi:MAG: YegP family protein [Myxococcota bacterium]